ncbi:hypothetical protein V8B97DRAFT_1724867 [Scleroderma yunnanense]
MSSSCVYFCRSQPTNTATSSDTSVYSTPTDSSTTTTSTSPTASPQNQAQSSTSISSSSSSHVGAIIGGVIGGVAFVACIAFGILLYLRRRRRKRIAPSSEFINSLKPGATPVFRLEPTTARDPEKSGLSHYLPTPPSPPPPFAQTTYFSSPAMSSMEFPDSVMPPNRSSASPGVEKPLEPNRYSTQPASGVAEVAHSHDNHGQDDDDQSNDLWDGDPIIRAPTMPRIRSRRPESAPASAHRPSSSQRSHQQPQNSYPGVSRLAVSQMSGFEPDSRDSSVQRATSLRPLRREDHHREVS